MRQRSRGTVGTLAFFGVCIASFSVMLISYGPPGPAFAVWTLLFALGVSLACLMASKLYFSGSTLLNYVISIVAGLGLGIGCAFGVSKYWGLASVPLLASWSLGGIVGVASTAFIQEGWGKWFQHVALVFGVGLAVAVAGLPRLMGQVDHDQTAAFCVLKWNPNAPELKIGTLARQSLTPKGVQFLEQQRIKGLLVNWGALSNAGDDPDVDSLGIVLLTKRPTQEVDLPQPDHCVIVYLQDGDHWKKFPADAPTLRRNLILAPSETKPKVETQFWMESADGQRQNGLLDTANDY